MMRPRHLTIAVVALAGVALLTAACGSKDDKTPESSVSRGATSIDVRMVDVAFEPTTLTVPHGKKVTFRFTNDGKTPHDAFIGGADAQADHEQEMRSGSGGMHHGEEEAAITVEPGKTGTLKHTFDEAGTVEIGCHQPGHYAGGMKVTVTVT
jgi:uncharacterized cupredoxin-like copper-binding protein